MSQFDTRGRHSLLVRPFRRDAWRICLVATGAVLALGGLRSSQAQPGKPTSAQAKPAAAASTSTEFATSIQPFLQKNCYACHNDKVRTADLSLTALKSADTIHADPETWEKVSHRLIDGTMPPKGMPKPAEADKKMVIDWIRHEMEKAEQATAPDPGRVTARRLNRAEYNNTIRDLLGIDFKPADDFPQDDSGYGFDNIGDVLSLSPVLMEKYLKAADSAVRLALLGPEKRKPMLLRAQPPGRDFELLKTALTQYDEDGLSLPNALHANLRFPADGEYTFRVAIEGRRPAGSTPAQIGIWIDGKLVKTLELDGTHEGFGGIDLFGAQGEFKLRVTAGDHWVAGTVMKIYEGLPASYGGPNPSKAAMPPAPDPLRFMKNAKEATPEQIAEFKKRFAERMEKNKVPANRVWVHYIEALGPYDQKIGPSPESLAKIYTCGHAQSAQHTAACTRTNLKNFARRAFRRPVNATELQPIINLAESARKNGATFEEALGVGLQAILVSPDFLFRIDRVENPSKGLVSKVADTKGKTSTAPGQSLAQESTRLISQHSLASRLSYFLWSSTPDDELLKAADTGTLRNPKVLEAQVRRMLKDPKAKALVDNFAGQWLELRRLESLTPDRDKFPQFDDYLRMSMRQETEAFFNHLMQTDGSLLDLLDAKYTFANEKLATFYGIPGVKGPEFRMVKLDGTPRAGVLTQASVLLVSSYATRTSPVLRGKWILENILNAPVPPPPPNVPLLDEAKIGEAASLRVQLEEHRKNAVCASCHSKMDPLGLAFENFSAIGQYRDKDGKFPIDPSGVLPDGRQFSGPEELRTILRQDSTAFVECVTDKMLTYALGRGLERYDKRTVREIARNVAAGDHRFSRLVLEIVNSLPFQKTRGDSKKA
jgi:cytochrome c5